jgi:hypothetical protein
MKFLESWVCGFHLLFYKLMADRQTGRQAAEQGTSANRINFHHVCSVACCHIPKDFEFVVFRLYARGRIISALPVRVATVQRFRILALIHCTTTNPTIIKATPVKMGTRFPSATPAALSTTPTEIIPLQPIETGR